MDKYYVYRIVSHNGRKEYKRTKCTVSWIKNRDACWQFSKQGAKRIADTLNQNDRYGYYAYGIEPV